MSDGQASSGGELMCVHAGHPVFRFKLSRSLPCHLLLQHTLKYQSQIGLSMSMTEAEAIFDGLLKIIFKIDAHVL